MSNHNIKFGIVVALAALMMLSYQSFSSHVLTGLASSSGNMITQLPALDAEKAETVIQIEEGTEKIVNRSKIARSKKKTDYKSTHASGPLTSTIHCVGDTFTDKAWVHRSCEFTNICFDRTEKDFVLFKPDNIEVPVHQDGGDISSSSSYDLSLSLGGVNPRWNFEKETTPHMRWFPRISDSPLLENYDKVDATLIPWHCMNGQNVGHLLWDDFLPIFTLLGMFGLEDKDLFIVRYIDEDPLWATCEFQNPNMPLGRNIERCRNTFKKWFKAIGVDAPFETKTLHEELMPATSNFLCFDRAVAGLGMLTDHGSKLHGWKKEDYEVSQNVGRGRIMWDFRNYIMGNFGLDYTTQPKSKPRIITVSTYSSQDGKRSLSFKKQIEMLRGMFEEDEAIVKVVQFSTMTSEEQIKLAAESSIMLTAVGGGSVTSMFLPKGASLILFYAKTPSQRSNLIPARLDWDYFNNAAYLRTHWFPIEGMDETKSLTEMGKLIRHELEIISSHE
mmetsp:Transcript_19968/g.41744  ORF Transcript_19968/g.41744 Transcript_19968/m.41744 type:complete len:502 (-) Transcript_19968:38-1543(-)